MKTIPYLVLGYLLLLFFQPLRAQQVVATSGDYFEKTGGSLSYTIGEISTETFLTTETILTQGVQQPNLNVTAVIKIAEPDMDISVYPNPASDYVMLEFRNDPQKALFYEVYDLEGKLLSKKDIVSSLTQIPFQELAAGSYLIKVRDAHKTLRQIKIVKTN